MMNAPNPPYGQPQPYPGQSPYGQPHPGQPQQPYPPQPGQAYGQPPQGPSPYGAPAPGQQPPAPAYGQQPQPAPYPAAQAPGAFHPGGGQGAPPVQAGQQQGVVIDTKFFPLAWMLTFFKPTITVDGYDLPATTWGRNQIPLPPGQHHVHVHVPYFLPPRIGPADLPVTVAPGQSVELEYRAPVWTFSRGSLGPGPQSYNGVGASIAIFAVAILLILLIILLPALAA
ncbi:hypothetical protein ACLQ3C_12705 [Gordonia sp. DT30]|uniref:hypothetical protein n=1 Tax=unclassified Gordonia (in: high G+C Gram-positive bacteria) TaxID=2657482 RepID=UPI003CEF7195